jgi:hypothetical protein
LLAAHENNESRHYFNKRIKVIKKPNITSGEFPIAALENELKLLIA